MLTVHFNVPVNTGKNLLLFSCAKPETTWFVLIIKKASLVRYLVPSSFRAKQGVDLN